MLSLKLSLLALGNRDDTTEVEVDAGLLGVFFMPPLVTATALEGDDLCNDLPRPGEEEEEVEDDLDFFMIIPYLYSKSGKDMLKWL